MNHIRGNGISESVGKRKVRALWSQHIIGESYKAISEIYLKAHLSTMRQEIEYLLNTVKQIDQVKARYHNICSSAFLIWYTWILHTWKANLIELTLLGMSTYCVNFTSGQFQRSGNLFSKQMSQQWSCFVTTKITIFGEKATLHPTKRNFFLTLTLLTDINY